MATKTAKTGGSMIKVTLTAGLVGKMDKHRKVVRALGLGKFSSSVVHSDSPTIRGMVRKVSHLVSVEPTTEQPKPKVHNHK
jgi:large subunit ribosomal protein L30